MKYVWMVMLIIPYLIWAYFSIKDAIEKWKKSTMYFLVITFIAIFIISLAMWAKSMVGG